MILTHLTVSNAKPWAKAYKLADADSLYLVVQPSGTRLWRMNYRYLGKQKKLHLERGLPSVSPLREGIAMMHVRSWLRGSIPLPKRKSRWPPQGLLATTRSRGSPKNG